MFKIHKLFKKNEHLYKNEHFSAEITTDINLESIRR